MEGGLTHFLSPTHTHLIKDVFACSPQNNGASLGLPTLHKICEVLISNLPHLKETTLSSNIRFFHFICTIAYCSPTCSVCVCVVCACACGEMCVCMSIVLWELKLIPLTRTKTLEWSSCYCITWRFCCCRSS